MAKKDILAEDKKLSEETIKSLIADLGSSDGIVRARARKSLVSIGGTAVSFLVGALSSKKESVRLEATKALDRINIPWSKYATEAIISTLIADLGSRDGVVRVRARKSLVAIGKRAIDPLCEALLNRKETVRWEAAKAIGQIGAPAAAPLLVRALEDRSFEVRWLAAEALISIGKESVLPLLQALLKRSDSVWLRDGAHHVLHDIIGKNHNEILQPVLMALEDIEPSLEVPGAAWAALRALNKG